MPTSPSPSETVVKQLAAWCDLAEKVLRQAGQPLQPPEIRAWKHHLLRLHVVHLAQWRERMRSAQRGGTAEKRPRVEAWIEVVEAMQARDEHVALSACALLERAILAAYERAAEHSGLDPATRRLLRRHQLELKGCRESFLREMQQERLHAAPARESAPALGGGLWAVTA